MAKDEYFSVGGRLRFKGETTDAGIKKKRKKAKAKALDPAVAEAALAEAKSTTKKTVDDDEDMEYVPSKKEGKAAAKDPEPEPNPEPYEPYEPYKTKAQLNFEAFQKARREREALKGPPKTYKERLAEFNDKLSKLTEHNDMPKIGPG